MTFKLDWRGKEVIKKQQKAAEQGLRDAAEHIGEQANRTAPIDEGTLRRSMGTDFDPDRLMSVVFYDVPYVERLHEASPGEFRFSDPNARVKWLELTLQERQKAIKDYLADALREGLR